MIVQPYARHLSFCPSVLHINEVILQNDTASSLIVVYIYSSCYLNQSYEKHFQEQLEWRGFAASVGGWGRLHRKPGGARAPQSQPGRRPRTPRGPCRPTRGQREGCY